MLFRSASVGPYEYNRVLTTPISGRVETTKSSQNGTATLSENAAGTAYIGNSATSETYDFVDSRGVSLLYLDRLITVTLDFC